MFALVLAFLLVGTSFAVERDVLNVPPLLNILRDVDSQDITCSASFPSISISCSVKKDIQSAFVNILGQDIPLIYSRDTQDIDIFGIPVSGSVTISVGGKRLIGCPITFNPLPVMNCIL
ncbi:uncharacterized protein LOC131939789 [Physella acuta]|uniref:uncharacterized protein LOC131939789 n=1 Tax=Physella acuta TaxID=109671 RepID=UPI0027DBBCB5|nr:uncharacterized protein LOC131939789 [Physella acuta]XP_059154282.1 uncharacterized protein LOC131939789 [Physella acuta]